MIMSVVITRSRLLLGSCDYSLLVGIRKNLGPGQYQPLEMYPEFVYQNRRRIRRTQHNLIKLHVLKQWQEARITHA